MEISERKKEREKERVISLRFWRHDDIGISSILISSTTTIGRQGHPHKHQRMLRWKAFLIKTISILYESKRFCRSIFISNQLCFLSIFFSTWKVPVNTDNGGTFHVQCWHQLWNDETRQWNIQNVRSDPIRCDQGRNVERGESMKSHDYSFREKNHQ